MNKLSDNLKIDVALAAVSLATTNATGPYFRMDNFRKALFVINAATMADAATVVAQVYQATDAAAGGAAVITKATCTITSPTKAKRVLLTTRSVAAADVVTINGLTFTGGTATDVTTRTFKADGNDAADATALCACINDTTYGVPGVLATLSTDVVYLTATEPGDNYITITAASGTIVPSVIYADAFIEIDASDLDIANGFDHVALKITTDATIVVSAMLIRGDERYSPTQYVAASESA